MPGVLGVFTGADLARDGLGAIPHNPVPSNRHDLKLRARDGGPIFFGPHLLLPTDQGAPRRRGRRDGGCGYARSGRRRRRGGARHLGASAVRRRHRRGRRRQGAGRVGRASTNVCVDASFGSDEAAVDAAFAGADHVVTHGVSHRPRDRRADRAASGARRVRERRGTLRRCTRAAAAPFASAGSSRRSRPAAGSGCAWSRWTSAATSAPSNRVYVEYGLVLWASRASSAGR